MKKCGLRMAQGGIVRGKGGPTDDMVPMQVAGKNVNLSDTEAVLPAKTVQALGGPEAVEALIAQTNGKPPVRGGLREGGEYADGNVFSRAGQWMKDQAKYTYNKAANTVKEIQQPKGFPTRPIPNDLKPLQPMQPASAQPQPQPGALNPARTRVNVTVDANRLNDLGRKAAEEANKFGKYHGSAVQAGQTFKASPAFEKLKAANPGKLPVAAGALTAGLEWAEGGDFWNDENVSNVDKARQLGRATLRSAGAVGAGAVGAGAGSVAGPVGTVVGGAVGGTAGYHAGDWLGEKIFGNPMEGYSGKPKSQPQARIPFDQLPQSDPSYDRKEFRSAVGNIAARQELDNPNIAGLRAAGVTGAVQGDVRATEGPYAGRTGATGIRTINTQNGKVYAGRDANGQLNISSNAGMSMEQNDAARDKQFAAAGYGKDAYGNWMTPQRIADKERLSQIQAERSSTGSQSGPMTLGQFMVKKYNDKLALKQQELGIRQQELAADSQRADSVANRQLGLMEQAQANAALAERRENRRMGADERRERAERLKETHSLIDQMYTNNKDGKVNNRDATEFKSYISQFDLDNVPGPDGKPLDRIQALTEAKIKFDAYKEYIWGEGGGSETYRDTNPVRVDKAGFMDLIRPGNGVMYPGQDVVVYDNNARISPRAVPKYDADAHRVLGLNNLDQLRQP